MKPKALVSLLNIALLVVAAVVLPCSAAEAQVAPSMYNGMQWRLIGPFRAGRVSSIVGVPGEPNVFYMGADDGGVWKSENYGLTWESLFKGGEDNSIGAIAVAPSNPDIVYVGSGEATMRPDLSIGDGLYKSTDAGKTWRHLGLRDGQQIASIAVDPHNPDRLFVAVLGHPFGANAERGVFRSTDGGQTFEKVLYKNEDTGAAQVALDPADPNTVYAVLWAARNAPVVIGPVRLHALPDTGLYKSVDGGTTWNRIGEGLPTVEQGLGRIRLAVAPSNPKRIYASVGGFGPTARGGMYRSEDAGKTFTRVSHDPRNSGGTVTVVPNNPDEIYVTSTALYRSMDGGKTFAVIRGAPGGNDYLHIWVNPTNPDIIAAGVDQGATISVDGGKTWSLWYNQPTAQTYSVITDNHFPYRVYSTQQDSGSFGILSRSNDGQITFRDWRPVGSEEDGEIAPDPLHSDIVYSARGNRFDWVTGETTFVGPQVQRLQGKYRFSPYGPIIFSHVDPHVLYLGANVLFKTVNGGHSWQIISPDLSRASLPLPGNFGSFSPQVQTGALQHLGVIYRIGPSFKDVNTIWVGTDDGLIWVTHDGGKHWDNVTPPAVTPWSTVTRIVASRFDDQTAYASVSRFRLNDLKPYIYRTRDGGKTWKLIVAGLPDNAPVNVVREDPVDRDLLIAGTIRGVWFSADDGGHWQPLQLNLPVSSVYDLVIHGSDVVVGTHGRADWILDDISPLRQLTAASAAAPAFLYKPDPAYLIPRNPYTDTQLPPEFPAGQNPPSGAIIDYYLKTVASGPVTLEVFDARGKLVRRYSSADKPEPVDTAGWRYPTYWLRSPQELSAQAGMHRFVWSLHYPAPDVLDPVLPMGVVYHDTPLGPRGPVALPGGYSVKLTVDGHSYNQPLILLADPRVHKPMAGLTRQFELGMALVRDIDRTTAALRQSQTKDRKSSALRTLNMDLVTQYNSLYGGLYGGGDGNASLTSTPTEQQESAVADLHRRVNELLGAAP